MFKSTHVLLAAMLIGGSLAHMPPADAQQPTQAEPGLMFHFLDRNGDGAVDRDELAAFRARVFERVDADRDGHLTQAERDAARQRFRERMAERIAQAVRIGGEFAERRAAIAQRVDRDGDGRISRAEFLAAESPMFDRADANGDGRISAVEWADGTGSLRSFVPR